MMVDFALDAERTQGKNSTEAIYEACLLRFRPILMTTMAALLAGLPLALGSGIGSELRRPLGIAMVGGLLLSQVLTLYTTPVIYIFFDQLGSASGTELGRRCCGGWRARPVARTDRIAEGSEGSIPHSAPPPAAAVSHEYLRALHPSAGSDHAAHSCHRHGRRGRSACCPSRRCRRWIFRPSPSAPAAGRAAPRSWPPRWPRRWSGSSAISPASPR